MAGLLSPPTLPRKLQELPPQDAHFCLAVERFITSELEADVSGSNVLVAFSGGADSCALLLSLFYLAPRLGITVGAAHVDHRLRPSSGEEAEACRQFAQLLGIPFHHQAFDVFDLSREHKTGIEECARNVRHAFLKKTAQAKGYDYVAFGHMLNDLAEDVLMRLIRGTGWPGLGGMPGMRPFADFRGDKPDSQAPYILRPLLGTSRSAIESFLGSFHFAWVEDESNSDESYLRNRVRHSILPLFTAENPAFLESVAHVWRLGRLDASFFEDVLSRVESATEQSKEEDEAALYITSPELAGLHKSLRLRLYKRCLATLGPGQALLSNLFALDDAWLKRSHSGARDTCHQFPGGKIALVSRKGIRFLVATAT